MFIYTKVMNYIILGSKEPNLLRDDKCIIEHGPNLGM